MRKCVKLSFGNNPQPNVIALVKELEEKGYLVGETIIYEDKDEALVASLFDKYYVPI